MVPRDEDGNKVNPVTCAEKSSDQKGVLELYAIVSFKELILYIIFAESEKTAKLEIWYIDNVFV